MNSKFITSCHGFKGSILTFGYLGCEWENITFLLWFRGSIDKKQPYIESLFQMMVERKDAKLSHQFVLI